MAKLIRLDVDANRDGLIDPDEPGRWDWAWGAGKPGAVALVDCDLDGGDQADWAEVQLVVEGDFEPDDGVIVSLDAASAGAVTVWVDVTPFIGLLGEQIVERRALPAQTTTLHVQVHAFPDASWDGLIELIARLEDGQQDRVIMRASPWIMPSTLQPPEEVYVVATGDNDDFLAGLRQACMDADVPLHEIQRVAARGDRWIQDELEIGYCQTPKVAMPVFLDGARDRGLSGLARQELGGQGRGVYELHAHMDSSSGLDAFGNLEVSPPVVIGGVDYRLGRIVHGTKRAPGQAGRKASLALRRFLHGQGVQAPLEVHSDWLAVGHVDEILSFVPSDSDRGWKVLLASPGKVRTILIQLSDSGNGDAVFFQGHVRGDGSQAARTTDELLGDAIDWAFNDQCVQHLGGVKEKLKSGLALGDDDFAEVPVAFKDESGGALAYFPDMVNHLILGPISVVPDPFGPVLDGTDPLKAAFLEAVGSRAPGVRFIDDWMSYHEVSGEVHCGTNVRRTPSTDTPWWELSLPGLWDASVRGRT